MKEDPGEEKEIAMHVRNKKKKKSSQQKELNVQRKGKESNV